MHSIKVLVLFMGLLILAGLGLLVYGVVGQVSELAGPGAPSGPSAPSGFDSASVTLPAGCVLAEAHLEAGRLVRVGSFADSPDPRGGRSGVLHHSPTFGIDAQGSSGGRRSPICNSSMEMPSGERMKAMCPSRGGRLIVTPASARRRQVS